MKCEKVMEPVTKTCDTVMTDSIFKIATLNVRRMVTRRNQKLISDYVKDNNIDVMLLDVTKRRDQEVCFSEMDLNSIGYRCIVNRAGGKGGTAILYRQSMPLRDIQSAASGRIIKAKLGNKRLINVYAPAGRHNFIERANFFKSLANRLAGPRVIVTGDFNATLKKVIEPSKESSAEGKTRIWRL